MTRSVGDKDRTVTRPHPERHVGFTGTRRGMTSPQASAVATALTRLQTAGARFFHHGDCIGADDRAATIAHELGLEVVMHPPTNSAARAWAYFDHSRPPHRYLVRNRHIVAECAWILACPATFRHELRSGTWSTIRAALDLDRRLTIIAPDGVLIDPRSIGAPQQPHRAGAR
ncbi:hypothetical protein GCM10009613_60720 [Pseudonocardia kongjuensis]|uniref:Uncharacterized protein n=1 Tax=Pseudonocardia kongjuensis TaxID=102227 RepID=A0ABP4J1Z6_9PSEU